MVGSAVEGIGGGLAEGVVQLAGWFQTSGLWTNWEREIERALINWLLLPFWEQPCF